jgi:1-phosphofructokinase
MTAGLAAALARGMTLTEALRLCAAAAALNVTRRGLATGERREIERLADHIELRELSAARIPGGQRND